MKRFVFLITCLVFVCGFAVFIIVKLRSSTFSNQSTSQARVEKPLPEKDTFNRNAFKLKSGGVTTESQIKGYKVNVRDSNKLDLELEKLGLWNKDSYYYVVGYDDTGAPKYAQSTIKDLVIILADLTDLKNSYPPEALDHFAKDGRTMFISTSAQDSSLKQNQLMMTYYVDPNLLEPAFLPATNKALNSSVFFNLWQGLNPKLGLQNSKTINAVGLSWENFSNNNYALIEVQPDR